MSITTEPAVATAFSDVIRTASAGAHRDAERTRFLRALLGGTLPLRAYARLVAQHRAIYEALEAANPVIAADPELSGFVRPEIARLAPLERDIVAVLGPDWREQPEAELLPATVAYCARLREVGAGWPGGWVGHQYVRYLGDLSGGLIIRSRIEAVYGIDETCGTAFYCFPDIADPAAWKADYRHRLDRAPWDADERACIVDEIVAAFRWNTQLFDQLHPQAVLEEMPSA